MELQKEESVCFKVNEGCRAVEKRGRKEVAGERKEVGGDCREAMLGKIKHVRRDGKRNGEN